MYEVKLASNNFTLYNKSTPYKGICIFVSLCFKNATIVQ